MRKDRIADWLFAGSAAAFAIAFYVRLHDDSWWASALYFFCQSAFIGSAADWFAVTALFRKPLGVPFHTALIPRNRMRVIRGIRRIAEQKLLLPGMWDKLIGGFSMSAWLYEKWTGREGEKMRQQILGFLLGRIPLLLQEQLGGENRRIWTAAAAGAILKEVRHALSREDAAERLLSRLLQAGEEALRRPSSQAFLEKEFREWIVRAKADHPVAAAVISMGEAMGVISCSDMAIAFASAAEETIHTWREPGNRVHLFLKEKVEQVLGEALSRADVETLLQRETAEALQSLFDEAHIERLSLALEEAPGPGGMDFRDQLLGMLKKSGDVMLCDPAVKNQIDTVCRNAAASAASYEHAFLGDAVENVLARYSPERLNAFIYDKTADELGGIRIHGAVVAAAAGSVIFTLLLLL